MSIRINCDRTKRGLPSLAEESNVSSDISTATIIAAHNGKAKKAIYIPKILNTLSNKHAFFVVKVNDVKIDIKKIKDSISVRVFKIKQFLKTNSQIEIELLESYDKENLDQYKNSTFQQAIEAGITKIKFFPHDKPAFYWYEKKLK